MMPPILRGRVGVVHRDIVAGIERLGDQVQLTALLVAVVPHQVLADVSVRTGEALPVERRLSRRL